MKTLALILAAIAMFAVLATLGMGLFSMARGGEFNEKYGNKFMQARVYIQGLALAMLALAYYISEGS